jgi:3',5'-cyclic AMP phosphodiesterase CpdA
VATVRLLHLSDLHIRTQEGWQWSSFQPALLEDVARNAFHLSSHYQAILLSGDLADSGEVDDLARAFDFLYAPPQKSATPWLSAQGRPTLQAAGKPIFFLPGNHDRFKSRSRSNPGGRTFDVTFRRGWPVGLGGVQRVPVPDKENPVLWLVFADFTLRSGRDAVGLTGHWGQGLVNGKSLKKLVFKTRTLQARDWAVVWVVHFAPEFEDLGKSLELLKGDDLMRSARALGVRHIFCGHTHKRRIYPKKAPLDVRVHCAGTASCKSADEDTTLHLLEIDATGSNVTEVREKTMAWNPSDRDFKYRSDDDFT